jgi:hypothetical protein
VGRGRVTSAGGLAGDEQRVPGDTVGDRARCDGDFPAHRVDVDVN